MTKTILALVVGGVLLQLAGTLVPSLPYGIDPIALMVVGGAFSYAGVLLGLAALGWRHGAQYLKRVRAGTAAADGWKWWLAFAGLHFFCAVALCAAGHVVGAFVVALLFAYVAAIAVQLCPEISSKVA